MAHDFDIKVGGVGTIVEFEMTDQDGAVFPIPVATFDVKEAILITPKGTKIVTPTAFPGAGDGSDGKHEHRILAADTAGGETGDYLYHGHVQDTSTGDDFTSKPITVKVGSI